MPVSPDVARVRPSIDHHITAIDTFLSKPWSTYERGSGRWYDARRMEQTEREAVMDTYRAAGWDVRWVDDQRDGSALVFKPYTTRDA